MDLTLKLSQEIATKLQDFFTSEKGTQFIAEVKAAKDEDVGRFKMIITTEDIDRVGEMIKADGWELERYMLNPIVLWAHNYGELPMGITDKLTKLEGGKLEAEGKFAPHEKAQTIRKLYDGGYLKTSSVGFIPKEMEGNIITKAELLEWSFVPVPCNPFALSSLSARGLNVDELITKGLIVKETPPRENPGDPCITADGKPGKVQVVDSQPVCMPNEKATKPAICEPENPDYDPEACAAIFCDTESPDYNQEFCDLMKEEDGKAYKGVCKLVDLLLDRGVELKEGRVLSKKNIALVEECVSAINNAKSALEALLEASRSEDAPVKEPEGKGGEQDEAFLTLREKVQDIASIVKDALADAKSEARSRGIKTRHSN